MPVSRNQPMGIEERTIKNLRAVKDLFDQSPDKTEPTVHVVTQVVNSLLGLVLRPFGQRYALHEDIKPLKHLYAEDWPKWTITLPIPEEAVTLGQLARHLRNAAAHGRYSFSSDSPHLNEVTITVEDKPHGENASVNWRAEISGDDLYSFCVHLGSYIEAKNAQRSES